MNEIFEKNETPIPDKSRRAIEFVRQFMRKSDDYRKPFLALADMAREQYEVWNRNAKTMTGRTQLNLPYAYQVIESEHPKICEIFFKDKPYFKFRGRSVEDMQWENNLADFMSFQVDQMRFQPKFIEYTKRLLIDGTAVAKVPYRFEEKPVTTRDIVTDPFLGIQYPTKKTTLEVVYDGPDFENIPLKDFFPDWSTRAPGDIKAMRGCVHRTWKTVSDLRASGSYKEKDLETLEHSITRKGTDAWADPYYKGDYGATDSNEANKRKPIEVWEYWGQFDTTGDGDFEEYIITVANGDVDLRCIPNFYDYQFKPFVACVNVMKDGDFYGISELFAVRGLIKEATALRNARLDQVNLTVNRMWIVDRTAGITTQSLYSRPNGIVFTNDMTGIRELPPPELPASSYREIAELNSEIQTTTASASGPALTEAGRVFGRSATGASLVDSIASSRAGLKARLLSTLFFHDLAQVMMLTDAQFVSEDQWVRVSDPNTPNPFAMLPKSAFHTDYDFEITTALESDSAKDFQALQNFMGIAQIAEQSQPGTLRFDVLFDEMGRQLLGRRIKKFTRTEAERMQMQQQQMAMEQASNAALGARQPQ